ncbi:MAG: hypothetical protein ACMUIA_00660 [bacterium]
MRLGKVKISLVILLFLMISPFAGQMGKGYAYYGLGGLYGGLYGGSGGLYGGLYGGLGLYGMGGLYGGLMGMMGGLYGMYGGLYGGGLTSPFGLQNMYYSINTGSGLNYQVPFLQIAPLLGMAGMYNSLFPSLFNPVAAAAVAAEQAGTWTGVWTGDLVSGPITLNLVTDPILGVITGYVQLLGNPYLGSLVPVDGTVLNSQIYLDGSGLGIGSQTIKMEIIGTLTSATTMTGTYTLINSTSIIGTGIFSADLTTPVI